MTTPADRERLVEQAAGAHRERDGFGNIRPSPAFFDLDEQGRRDAFESAFRARAIEAALDEAGRSATVHAVLARIARTP